MAGRYTLNGAVFGRRHIDGYFQGLKYNAGLFNCCGTGELAGFGSLKFSGFADCADFLSGLYKLTGKGAKQLIFVVTGAQFQQRNTSYQELGALVRAGAVEIHRFTNQQPFHNTVLIAMLWNPRDGVGKFYNESGDPFDAEPKVTNVAVPEKQ